MLTDLHQRGYGPRVPSDHNGWLSLSDPPPGAESAHVRARRDGDTGRLVITDLFVHGDGLTSETLRGIALSRIEAGLNGPSFEFAELDGGATDDDVTVAGLRERGREHAQERRERRPAAAIRPPLQRPDRTDPGAFYALVANAYGQYAAESRAPAKAIAEEAGVPTTTAHRWIREARRRGFLPPGRKGRAG